MLNFTTKNMHAITKTMLTTSGHRLNCVREYLVRRKE